MFHNFRALFFLFCLFCSTSSILAYPKYYRIVHDMETIESQFSKIINEIKKLPNEEPITIFIDGGYFNISKTINLKDVKHDIIIIGSKKSPTIISGSIKVEGWEQQTDGLWKSRVPIINMKEYLPDQLFVNDQRAVRSRTPNEGAFIVNEGFHNNGLYGVKLKAKDVDELASFKNEEIPILTLYRNWTASKRYVASLSRVDSTIYFSGLDFPSFNQLRKGNGLAIENTKSCIDKPGEWYANRAGYIYYLPKEGETIENTEFRIPVIERLLTIEKVENVVIKNITFEHTSFQIPKDGVEYTQAAQRMSAAIEIDNASNLEFEDCEIRNTSNYGIWFRQNCSKSTVKKTYFHDLGAGAVKIGTLTFDEKSNLTNRILIENNIIYHYGQLMEGAVSIILFNASDCKIVHNDIHYGNYTGINVGWVWGFRDSPSKNNEVAYNRLSHIGLGLLDDLGGIYTLGRSEGTHLHHNYISYVTSTKTLGWGWGIYLDEGSSGIIVDDNIINRCDGGFHLHYGSNNVFKNNIIAMSDRSQFAFSSEEGDNPLTFENNIILMNARSTSFGKAIDSKKIKVRKNCYWSISSESHSFGSGDVFSWIKKRDTTSFYQDPGFRYPKEDDYRLKNKGLCKAIGFEPFDYSKAGVYGKKKWRKLAESCNQ